MDHILLKEYTEFQKEVAGKKNHPCLQQRIGISYLIVPDKIESTRNTVYLSFSPSDFLRNAVEAEKKANPRVKDGASLVPLAAIRHIERNWISWAFWLKSPYNVIKVSEDIYMSNATRRRYLKEDIDIARPRGMPPYTFIGTSLVSRYAFSRFDFFFKWGRKYMGKEKIHAGIEAKLSEEELRGVLAPFIIRTKRMDALSYFAKELGKRI